MSGKPHASPSPWEPGEAKYYLESMIQPAWVTDSQGVMLYQNKTWHAWVNNQLPKSKTNDVSLIDPTDRNLLIQKLIASQKSPTTFEAKVRTAGFLSNLPTMKVKISPILNDQDQLKHWVWVSDLQPIGNKVDEIFEEAPFAVFVTDDQGQLLWQNKSLSALTGLTLHQARGMGWASRIHPDDRDRIIHEWHNLLTQGKDVVSEFRHLTTTGDCIYVLTACVPIRGEENQVLGFWGIVIDTTSRVQAQKELSVNQERLNHALKVSGMGLWDIDLIQHKIWRSEHHDQVFGISPNRPEWGSETFFSLIHPDDREWLKKKFTADPESNLSQFQYFFRTIWPDRSIHWLRLDGQIIRNVEGKAIREMGSVVDVTELKVVQTTLEHSIQLRDEFLSFASHELKQPMGTLLLTVQLLQRKYLKSISSKDALPDLTADMIRMQNQVLRLNGMLDRLLEFSRIQNKRFHLDIMEVDFCELVLEVIDRFKDDAKTTGTVIHFADCRPVQVEIDRFRMSHVVTSLITNAIEYGQSRPVSVAIENTSHSVQLNVKDQGRGISEADQIDLFNRVGKTRRSSSGKGMGLGLFLACEIVKAHGGNIYVVSQIGGGSTFTVELPLRQNPSATD